MVGSFHLLNAIFARHLGCCVWIVLGTTTVAGRLVRASHTRTSIPWADFTRYLSLFQSMCIYLLLLLLLSLLCNRSTMSWPEVKLYRSRWCCVCDTVSSSTCCPNVACIKVLGM